VPASFGARPWFAIFPLAAFAGLVGIRLFLSRGDDLRAFLASALFLLAMMLTAVAGIHPTVLPSSLDPAHALTVASTAAPDPGLRIGIAWWIPGMALVVGYFVFTYRRFAGKVEMEGEGY
jgi:cytochrome d ubiquinol oxidase subunit II